VIGSGRGFDSLRLYVWVLATWGFETKFVNLEEVAKLGIPSMEVIMSGPQSYEVIDTTPVEPGEDVELVHINGMSIYAGPRLRLAIEAYKKRVRSERVLAVGATKPLSNVYSKLRNT
jgi:hypothetical protein